MAETIKKKTRYITAACECRYPWLTTPDTKFKAEGKYRVELLMSMEQLTALAKEVMPDVNEQKAKVQKGEFANWKLVWPVKDEINDETEKPTGRKIIMFEQNAKITRGNGQVDALHVVVVDSKNKPVPADVKLGTGSVLKIAFKVRVVESKITKDIRIKFHPMAAQIISLVEWKQDFGFEEEDGYTADGNGFDEPATTSGLDDFPFGSEEPPSQTITPSVSEVETLRNGAQVKAWQEYKAAFPGPVDAMNAGFKNCFEAYFPGKTKEQIGIGQWRQFVSDKFKRPATEAEFDPEGTFKADELPI